MPDPTPTATQERPSGLLSPVDLARLSSLALRARTIIEGALAGVHRNLHAGASLEFTEHKEYAPGDDIRRIDWKAVARTDRYTIKRFEDETEMRVLLVLDASASMGYGRASVSKFAYATYLGAALAYLVGQQGDAAGLLVYGEDTRTFLPPSTRPGQIREVLAAMENTQAAGTADGDRALDAVADLCDKRSLILVFSDLLDSEPAKGGPTASGPLAERLRQLRARGHDVVLCQVLDADEIELPFDDLMFFEGMEPGDTRTLLAEARDLAQAFREESLAFRERWRSFCLEARIEYRLARTDLPPAELLHAFLADRAEKH